MAVIGAIGERGSVVIPFEFDHTQPDYLDVLRWRADFLHRIRTSGSAKKLKAFYRTHPAQFIADWGVTFEPRNPEIGLPSKIPFILFPRQVDWLDWAIARWRARERGITVKSRGSGVSWLAVALACTLCLFEEGITIGFGSRKAELVDQLGDPKSLFFKARMFLANIPPEFRGAWDEARHAREMRLAFPWTSSAITGEAGDQLGRGDRTSIYFVDEAAFLEHPEIAEGSLSDTTNCRIDISTAPRDASSPFWDRVDALPEHQVFRFSWRDDPRRTPEWEAKKRGEIAPVIFAREYEMSRDEGGSFFSEDSLLVEGQPVEDPLYIDAVFATIDTAVKTGKGHSGLGCVRWGIAKLGQIPYPLVVLDWDYTQMEGAFLETWLPGVFTQLEEDAARCKARLGSLGTFIEDKASGMVLLQQGVQRGWPVHAIDSKLTAMGKSERAIDVSGHVHTGKVKFTRRAYEKVVSYLGVTKNHLLAQVLGFRAGTLDTGPNDLLDCWSYGIAIALGNQEGF